MYQTVHGSRALRPRSPRIRLGHQGIVVGPAAWYHGFRGGPEQLEESADHVLFEVRKFFRLAAEANPTLLEVLFTDPRWHRVQTPAGERLLAARAGFLSRQVAGSFGGYALSQLKRIQTHRRWLLTPPKAPESRGLRPARARRRAPRPARRLPEPCSTRASPWTRARTSWNCWTKAALPVCAPGVEPLPGLAAEPQPGPGRAGGALRLRHQARPAPHPPAAHGGEILRGEGVIVTRPDRDELLAIRDGALTHDALLAEAERLGAAVRAAEATSPCRWRPASTASTPSARSSWRRCWPHDDPDLDLGRRFVAERGPAGQVLLCAVTGAHLYGFPSPDSDLDLKGIHLAPTPTLLGLQVPSSPRPPRDLRGWSAISPPTSAHGAQPAAAGEQQRARAPPLAAPARRRARRRGAAGPRAGRHLAALRRPLPGLLPGDAARARPAGYGQDDALQPSGWP
ncbi:MAG: nucleotidyltransferase domain-containing protein [bacterium]